MDGEPFERVKKEFLTRSQTRPTSLGSRLKGLRLAAAHSLRSPETDVESVGIVTNDFHVFRALCLARKNGGFTFYGVPARSTVFGFIHYAMREFFTLSVSIVRRYI